MKTDPLFTEPLVRQRYYVIRDQLSIPALSLSSVNSQIP